MQADNILEQWRAWASQQLERLPYVVSLLPATEQVRTKHAADSWLGARFDDAQLSPWLAIWPLALLLVFLYLRRENDLSIRYRVPSPRTPDKIELLSNPSIKVCPRSRIYTYGSLDMDNMTDALGYADFWDQCHSMLRPSNRPIPRLHQRRNPCRNRPRH